MIAFGRTPALLATDIDYNRAHELDRAAVLECGLVPPAFGGGDHKLVVDRSDRLLHSDFVHRPTFVDHDVDRAAAAQLAHDAEQRGSDVGLGVTAWNRRDDARLRG